VIEPALYFLLGFLSSGLLALIIAPAIWGRAVRLTRRRIEASQPLTLAEIRADRDQLRADFAVTSRRLELNIADLRNKAANQRIAVSRTQAERDDAIAERQRLAEDIKIYQSELNTRGEGIGRLEDEIRALQSDLDQRNHLISGLELRVRELTGEINGHKLEIATLNTRLEAAGSHSDSVIEARRLAEARVANLTAEIERRGSVIAEERERAERLLAELQSLKANGRSPKQSTGFSQIAATERDDNERPAIQRLEAENAAIEARMRELADERDTLLVELQAVKVRDLSIPADAADIALLKDRLGDIAARIATLGPGSNAPAGPADTHVANANQATVATSGAGDDAAAKRVDTLAGKIEALREAAANDRAS